MQLQLNSNFIEHYSLLLWFNKVNVPIEISIELNLGELNQIKQNSIQYNVDWLNSTQPKYENSIMKNPCYTIKSNLRLT